LIYHRCVDTRRITPYDGGPSTDDIDQYFVDSGLSKSDVYKKEEEDSEIFSPPKSSKKKNPVLTTRNRTLSTESFSSVASDSDDDARTSKVENIESIFDDFQLEEKPTVSQKADSEMCSTEDRQNVDRFLTSFFSGQNHDVPKLPTPTEPKRFSKLSQKERKKLSAGGQSMKTGDEKEMSPNGNFHSTNITPIHSNLSLLLL
jgi:hypothetical protein